MFKFQELFLALNKKKVRYIVVGGIAVNLYGIERATADIDIVVNLEKNNLKRFIEVMNDIGFKPKISVRLEDFTDTKKRESWIKEKRMRVFSLFDTKNPFFILDVFVEEPFDFKTVFKLRERMRAGKVIIPVVPLKELINMKEKTGRPQDISDAYYLKKIIEDWKYEK